MPASGTRRIDAPPQEASRAALQRRVLTVVVIAQVFSGAGLAAGVTVGALLAQQMLNSTGLAGLPAALFTGGSAAAALAIGRLSQRYGRRPGLALGYLVGAVGALGAAVAAITDSIWLLLASLTVYGAGAATNLQARYAGADLAEPDRRGRAVSTVLVATTLGAVAGPNLVGLTGDVAVSAGAPALSGPFVLAAAAYGASALVLQAFLRPDPLLTATRWAGPAAAADVSPGATERAAASRRVVVLAATAMVLTQVAMVALMTMAPIHMTEHGQGLDAVGVVIAVHIAAMYLPSPVTGWLADRYGRHPVLVGAGVVLALAGVSGALSDPESVLLASLTLGLLGLGWNLGLIGGTALITDATAVHERARTQGAVDLTIALAGASGGLASGVIVASSGFPLLSVLGGIAGLLILPAALAGSRRAR